MKDAAAKQKLRQDLALKLNNRKAQEGKETNGKRLGLVMEGDTIILKSAGAASGVR